MMFGLKERRCFPVLILLCFCGLASSSRNPQAFVGRNRATSLSSQQTAMVLQVRGGGGKKVQARTSKKAITTEKREMTPKTKAIFLVSTAVSSWVLWVYRESWTGLFNREKMLDSTLEVLRNLNSYPKHYSYTIYTLGMALWETLGLSTIPVETAAGMVFGWNGFFLSAAGKMLGAVAAFIVGRYGVLAEFIQGKLSDNQVILLLDDVAEHHPFAVLLLLKASCFPETIKNYGSALLKPIQLWMFVLGTAVHGWLFSGLWTYFGVDTALRLETPSLAVDAKLQFLLSLALVNGFVISPLSMAYGVKALRSSAAAKKKSSKGRK